MVGTSVMEELIENYTSNQLHSRKPVGRWYLDLLVKRLYYIEWMAVMMGWIWLLVNFYMGWSYY